MVEIEPPTQGFCLTTIKHPHMPGKKQHSEQASAASMVARKGKWKLLETTLNHQVCSQVGGSQPLSSYSKAG